MGQIDRDYWYRPKEFRNKGANESPAFDDLFQATRIQWSPQKSNASQPRRWHWFEFFVGILLSVIAICTYPVQIFTAVQWVLVMLR